MDEREIKMVELRKRQSELGYSFMPFNGQCLACGYDFTENERSFNEVITGCFNVRCSTSYCE